MSISYGINPEENIEKVVEYDGITMIEELVYSIEKKGLVAGRQLGRTFYGEGIVKINRDYTKLYEFSSTPTSGIIKTGWGYGIKDMEEEILSVHNKKLQELGKKAEELVFNKSVW